MFSKQCLFAMCYIDVSKATFHGLGQRYFIMQELIQNADDAQATEVAFLIDWRYHSTDDVMFSNFEKYQGPALYAWNNAVFKKKDWYSLAKIDESSKKDDVSKAGRFGLGFQSVFHITGTFTSW